MTKEEMEKKRDEEWGKRTYLFSDEDGEHGPWMKRICQLNFIAGWDACAEEYELKNKKENKMHFTNNDPTQLVQRINNDFTYHCPPPEKNDVFKAIRNQAKELAHLIAMTVPQGREQATALTRLEEAVMHANAGIARQYPKE